MAFSDKNKVPVPSADNYLDMSIVSVLHEWQYTLLDLALPFCSRYKGEVFVKERNQTKVELVKLLIKTEKLKQNKTKQK